MASKEFGRRGSTGTFTDTIPAKSAEQAMLLKIDELQAQLNSIIAAINASTSGTDLQSGLAALALAATKTIKLVP